MAGVNVTRAGSSTVCGITEDVFMIRGVLWGGRKDVSGAAVAIAFKVLLELQDFNMNHSHPLFYWFLCNHALLEYVLFNSLSTFYSLL